MRASLSGFSFVSALSISCCLVAGSAAAQARPARASQLSPTRLLEVNRVQCVVTSTGELCTDNSATTVIGGGFWPKNTPDQYVFRSGLQLAGIIPASAGFAWAGDTVGAYIHDGRGTQEHSVARTGLYDSRDTADVAIWPNAAIVRDASLFDASYLGRNAVSEQDLWSRYWDGNPFFLSGRTHPMGIAVDQRTMVWNHPGGNQDITYFVFTIYNVTARIAAAYANATIPPEVRGEIAAIGAVFQDSNEARLSVAIPDGGYAIDSLYLAIGMDPDVGEAGHNNATAIMPFGVALAYQSDFRNDFWSFPAEIFGWPPFTPAPGFVAMTFPRRPADIAIFSTFTGSPSGHAQPVGVKQLWRYLSGVVGTPDSPCSSPSPRVTHYCFVGQTDLDERMQLSLGPFSLGPGEATTVVAAYLFAAPLDTVDAYAGFPLRPGVPFTGDSIAADTTKLRVIDRAAGWLTQNDANGNGVIEANEVTTARQSLLHKAQVAQAFVDAKFLVPSAPAAPSFFLVPGENSVTVVWQPSATETAGDPYYQVARDPSSPLYDPNFRRFDVEGYRIYRGRDPRALELVAQVDHDTTTFVDYLGAVARLYSPYNCAPELGLVGNCPVPFGPLPDSSIHMDHPISSQLIQFSEGGRVVSTNGAVTVVRADTFPSPSQGFPPLGGAGVQFVYEDHAVSNSFRYYYAVTAFDYNSIRSGPTSLESPRFVKPVTPRVSSGQEVAGGIDPARLLGGDGSVLDPAAPLPTIAAATGIFSGPMPPTDGFSVVPLAFMSQLVTDGSFTVRIDSIATGSSTSTGIGGRPALYYVSSEGSVRDSVIIPVGMDGFSNPHGASARLSVIAVNDSQAARFGGDSVAARLPGQVDLTVPGAWRVATWGRASVNGDPAGSDHNGPRWWTGTPNETVAGPNELVCTPATTGCVQPDLTRNAGTLAGITVLFHLQAYSTVPSTPMRDLEGIGATVTRAADIRVYWGASGAVDSVVDLTHRVRVPFSPRIGASWGILNDSSFILAGTTQASTADGNNALLTWSDAFCVKPAPEFLIQCGGPGQSPAILQNHARSNAVAALSSTYAGTSGLSQTGTGFIFYLNGHFFLMQGAIPAAGTTWNARFYSGAVTGTRAQANYAFQSAIRPPAVPGLRAEVTYRGSQFNPMVTSDTTLRRVHTVPDPFYVASGYELTADTLALKFVNLPARAIIRIYSVSGILVAAVLHNDATGGGEATWNLDGRSGRRVASGVYFFHIETPDGRSRVGRFTVITGPRR